MINAVAIQFPTLFVIDQVGDHHLVQHLIMHGRVFNGEHIFDTPIEIARHPVGRADIDLRLPVGQFLAIAKGPYPAVLQKTADRSEEHTSELQSLMRISYAVFCLKKKKTKYTRS